MLYFHAGPEQVYRTVNRSGPTEKQDFKDLFWLSGRWEGTVVPLQYQLSDYQVTLLMYSRFKKTPIDSGSSI